MRFWAIILSLAVAAAQAPPAGSKVVTGEVTSIDAAAKQFKVKGDDGVNYTVALQDNTIYLRMPLGETDQKKATKIALSDIAVGDRLLTRGPVAEDKTVTVKTVITMTKGDVVKKQQQDAAEWQKRGIAGTITAVNPAAKEITIDTHGRGVKTVVVDASAASFRRYAADSVRFADTKASSFAELQPGDTIRALGAKNEDGTQYKAEELVSGSFQTIAATVVSVNAANGDVVVNDLKTKKPVTVHTNASSMLRRLDERAATYLARRMRPDAGGGAPEGGPGGAGPGGGRPPGAGGEGRAGAGAPGGMRGAFNGQGGPGGPGGPRGGGGTTDLQQTLEQSPQLTLAELKKGDALIISSAKAADGAALTAISLVAGVEPFLAAAPRTAGQVDLGSWNLGVGAPEQ
ncbi:MAG TPA: hypothetical protein VGV35_20985 [Bryobacteraceae bacterium]|nr:hypothetical protein [Bryobacteraceae bacterium]